MTTTDKLSLISELERFRVAHEGADRVVSLVEYLMLPECGGCNPNRRGLSTHYESRQHPPVHLECWRDRPPAATLDDPTGGA